MDTTGQQTDAFLAELLVKREKLGALLDEFQPGSRPAALEARVRSARGYAYLGLQRFGEAEKSFQDAIALSNQGALALAGLAQVYAIESKNAEAEALLVHATQQDPTLADAWLLLGYVRLWQGNRAGARIPFDKAVEQAPNSEPAHRARALFLIGVDETAAQRDINVLLEQNPNHPVANLLDAAIKAEHGHLREAETALQNIQNIDQYPPALYLLARIDFVQGELGQTELNLNRLLQLTPDEPSALTLRAALLMRRGNFDVAIDVLKRVLSVRGQDRMTLSMLADCYTARNDRGAAAAILAQIAKLPSSDPNAFSELAAQQARLGNLSDAVATLQAARAMGPLSSSSVSLLIADYLEQKNIDAAWTAAKSFSDASHGSAEAQVMLGVVALRRDGVDVARGYFEKAIQLDPGLVAAQLDLAGAYRLQGKISQARDTLDAAAEKDPNNLDIILARADLERQQQMTEAEITWLERARVVAPTATAPRLTLATLYLQRKEADKALAIATELTRIDANDPRSVAVLGQAQLANRQQQSAIISFQRLVAMTDGAASAQLQLAQAYVTAGDRENAGGALRKALDRSPDDPAIQAAVLEFANRYKEIDSFVAFVRDQAGLHPADFHLQLLLGRLLFSQGQTQAALAALSSAVAKGGGIDATLELAQAQASTGAPDAAIATLRAAPQDAPRDRRLHVMLARLLGATGHYQEAIAEHEKLLAEKPDDPLLLNDLAWLYLQTGDSRALSTAQEAHRLAPNISTIDDTLGWILLRQGKPEEGLKLLEQATSEPKLATPGMKYRLAVAFNMLGRDREARAAVEEALSSGTNFTEAKDAEALRDKLRK